MFEYLKLIILHYFTTDKQVLNRYPLIGYHLTNELINNTLSRFKKCNLRNNLCKAFITFTNVSFDNLKLLR